MYMGQDQSPNGVYPNLDATYLVASSWQSALASTANGGECRWATRCSE